MESHISPTRKNFSLLSDAHFHPSTHNSYLIQNSGNSNSLYKALRNYTRVRNITIRVDRVCFLSSASKPPHRLFAKLCVRVCIKTLEPYYSNFNPRYSRSRTRRSKRSEIPPGGAPAIKSDLSSLFFSLSLSLYLGTNFARKLHPLQPVAHVRPFLRRSSLPRKIALIVPLPIPGSV